MRDQIANLFEKEMDRKDFLRHIGIAFVAVVGLSTILTALERMSSSDKTGGYGGSAYGE